MDDKLKSIAKDPYADMQVPFAVGSWCREHRLNVLAVNIRRAVATRNTLSEQIVALEKQRDDAEAELASLCRAVTERKLGVANV